MAALAEAVGASRAAIRLSPWDRFQHMRMVDPIPQFSYLVQTLAERHPDLAYIHVTEARGARTPEGQYLPAPENLEFLRKIWSPRPFIACGGYTPETAIEAAEEAQNNGENFFVAFARHFLANVSIVCTLQQHLLIMSKPDLPTRIQKGIALNAYDRSTFYVPGSAKGYIDYPFAE